MTTDTSERGLERLIYAAPTGESQNPASDGAGNTHERLAAYGPGWPATVCLAPLRLFGTSSPPSSPPSLELLEPLPEMKPLARFQREV